MQASSLRNSANRKNQKNSSCLGRKSAAVAREEMAMAKGVPESSIGRVESYKFIHKRKSGEPQDPELVVSMLEISHHILCTLVGLLKI